MGGNSERRTHREADPHVGQGTRGAGRASTAVDRPPTGSAGTSRGAAGRAGRPGRLGGPSERLDGRSASRPPAALGRRAGAGLRRPTADEVGSRLEPVAPRADVHVAGREPPRARRPTRARGTGTSDLADRLRSRAREVVPPAARVVATAGVALPCRRRAPPGASGTIGSAGGAEVARPGRHRQGTCRARVHAPSRSAVGDARPQRAAVAVERLDPNPTRSAPPCGGRRDSARPPRRCSRAPRRPAARRRPYASAVPPCGDAMVATLPTAGRSRSSGS